MKDKSGCPQNPEKFSGSWALYGFSLCGLYLGKSCMGGEAQALKEGWSCSESQRAAFSVAGRWSAWPWSFTIGTHTSLSLRREVGLMTGKATEASSQLPSKGRPRGQGKASGMGPLRRSSRRRGTRDKGSGHWEGVLSPDDGSLAHLRPQGTHLCEPGKETRCTDPRAPLFLECDSSPAHWLLL